jgi:cytochrome bd ubiquinol oxidase subunit II
MSKADAAAGILWVGATFYALFGGADFGGGFWDLIAGDAEKGERPRGLIQRSLTPVWEANHVWLIFVLVVLWTAFPPAFSAIFSTLYVPIALAALGIVLRGAGFAFRKQIEGLSGRRAMGATFAISSVLTPFFMGATVGAIASGNVPADGNGDAFSSWLQPLPLLTGAMFVATSAYLAAVFLVGDARRADEEDLERYFVRRALVAAAVAGAFAAIGLVELHAEARYVFDRLIDQGLPLIVASATCGLALLALLLRPTGRKADNGSAYRPVGSEGRARSVALRPLAAGAVVGVIWGWGVAQFPYLLPTSLRIDQAAAPDSTLTVVFIVFAIAAVLVLPSLALLYTLSQRDVLEGEH